MTEYHTLRDGTVVTDPRLDRLVSYDDRSLKFPVSASVRGLAFPTRGRGWSVKKWLDQGREGACVSFAWHHEAIAVPARAALYSQPTSTVNNVAQTRYKEMQKIDEWAGEDYEGTSVLAGAKLMRGYGYFDAYRWCFTLRDIIMALAYEGPVVMGTNWYEGMYDPDDKGFLRPQQGDMVGGHSWLISSFSVANKTVGMWNSWGQDWGNNGRANITWDDLEFLLYNDGEGCVPTGRHVV